MKRYRKRRWRNKHHLIPKSRGGNGYHRNLLLIDGELHIKWHQVFKNRTLDEVIALLVRVRRAKASEGVP